MYDVTVIGGGPAGLAAGLAAREEGLRVLIVERDRELGGILNQCIHDGFGLHYFKEALTGPEYALRFVSKTRDARIETKLDTMALGVRSGVVHTLSRAEGYRTIETRAVVLAMGCRERTRGAIALPGSRPAGIFTAGTAQRYINMEGYMVGRRAVVLGSGDVGLIMARRMTLEGAKVLACIEVMPYSAGLTRNIEQCLRDNDIPLYLSHTIVDIQGRDRVERVTVARVDDAKTPVAGTEFSLDCDTVLFSVGLIPENELTRQAEIKIDERTRGAYVYDNMETLTPGIFACGNVVHVHDLVDYVTLEGERAGKAAAAYAKGEKPGSSAAETISVQAGDTVAYTVPQYIRKGAGLGAERVSVSFRVRRSISRGAIVVKEKGSGFENGIARFPRQHMSPGEMERITLPAGLIERIRSDAVSVAVEEIS
jgi:NADPH-dependent 2,4-dienoyl-CoA reductase/sulfur reductase-like enzyme